MHLQLILTPLPQNCRITPRPRIIQHHRLLKQLEPIDLIDSIRSRLHIVEHNKRLPLGLHVRFRDYIDDGAVF